MVKYARILNVSDAVHSIRSLCKLLSSYRDRDVFKTSSNVWYGVFTKKIMPEYRCAAKFFPGRLSVAEYISITLIIPKYPWKYLKKLFWLCQDPENVWSSYVFHQAFEDVWDSNYARVLNMVRLHMKVLHRILNMTESGSICLDIP